MVRAKLAAAALVVHGLEQREDISAAHALVVDQTQGSQDLENGEIALLEMEALQMSVEPVLHPEPRLEAPSTEGACKQETRKANLVGVESDTLLPIYSSRDAKEHLNPPLRLLASLVVVD